MDVKRVRELYREPEKYCGKAVCVEGWARTFREGKQFGFIALNDGSFFEPVQIVIDRSESWASELKISTGAALRVTGELRLTPKAPQPFEISAKEIEVAGDCPPEYPMQKKRHSVEFLRTIPHLRPRTNLFSAVFRVRSAAAMAVHEFFQSRDFVYVHTPIITTSDCEGAGEMFRVTTLDLARIPMMDDGSVDFSEDFFSAEAMLTVSGQLNVEAFALSMRDVYTFGPTFRAELSNTPRHAAEFWMIEPEMAFCDLNCNLDMIELVVKYIVRRVYERCPEEMAFFEKRVDTGLGARLENLMSSDFGRMTYTEAIDALLKSGKNFQFPVSWGCDLQTEHERYLSEELMGKPVFVTDYPKEIKAFYMRLNDDGKTVAAADLLVPGVGEMVGGSQREERYDVLMRRLEESGMDPAPYWWYLELRKFGGAPHSGFGLGFERMLMYMTGVSNIRDVIPFPRTTGSAEL